MPTIFVNKDELPERKEFDFYPTPAGLVRAALPILKEDEYYEPILVLDPGAGYGVWGQEVKRAYPLTHVTGIEIQDFEQPDGYDKWINGDYLTMDVTANYDLIVGNPPYKFAQEWVEKSLEIVTENGYVLFLFRTDFLGSIVRYETLFNKNAPKRVSVSARRPSFTGNRKTGGDNYAAFLWSKKWRNKYYLGDWFNWDYLDTD